MMSCVKSSFLLTDLTNAESTQDPLSVNSTTASSIQSVGSSLPHTPSRKRKADGSPAEL